MNYEMASIILLRCFKYPISYLIIYISYLFNPLKTNG